MRDLLNTLINAVNNGQPAAWCRLVETRGSTPQKAGAAMIIFPDGSQAGTLGGGCVEADVKRQAIRIIADDHPEIVTFELDHDYGWDDGLICGGRMRVLIQPVTSAGRDYFSQLSAALTGPNDTAEVIVFDGSAAELAACATYLFDADGHLAAQMNTDASDNAWIHLQEVVHEALHRREAVAQRGVAVLPIVPRTRLLIVGAGHVGHAVAMLANDLGFDVWIVDDREEFVTPERFPHAQRRIAGSFGQVLPGLPIDANTFCLIVTRGHNHDQEALFHLAQRGARYVGVIGSKRKIKMIFEDLVAAGIPPEVLAQVHAPVGLDIGSQTVPEIAISIAAELIADRNRSRMRRRSPAPSRLADARAT